MKQTQYLSQFVVFIVLFLGITSNAIENNLSIENTNNGQNIVDALALLSCRGSKQKSCFADTVKRAKCNNLATVNVPNLLLLAKSGNNDQFKKDAEPIAKCNITPTKMKVAFTRGLKAAKKTSGKTKTARKAAPAKKAAKKTSGKTKNAKKATNAKSSKKAKGGKILKKPSKKAAKKTSGKTKNAKKATNAKSSKKAKGGKILKKPSKKAARAKSSKNQTKKAAKKAAKKAEKKDAKKAAKIAARRTSKAGSAHSMQIAKILGEIMKLCLR